MVPLDVPAQTYPDWLAHGSGLGVVFQPIFGLSDGALLGFEGLIRGPAGSPLESPAALFARAEQLGAGVRLERLAARAVVQAFAAQGLPGGLFLNLSCDAVLALAPHRLDVVRALAGQGLGCERLVIELTEHRAATDLAALASALAAFRHYGGGLALDDYGTAHSSLALALELKPEFIKLDKCFVQKVAASGEHRAAAGLIQQLSERIGARVIAEGIEDVATLEQLRAMGVAQGQGYLLARPAVEPARVPAPAALAAIRAQRLGAAPHERRRRGLHEPIGLLLEPVAPVSAQASVDAVRDRLLAQPDVACLPVLDGAGRPLGLIERRAFMDRYARPFQRELFGRGPVTAFVEHPPLVVEHATPLETVAARHAVLPEHERPTGFVILDAGRYAGVGRIDALLRRLAERSLETARHANPLTLLPGQVPTEQHLCRLLAERCGFVACWADLDHFKSFNDHHGWRRGDEALLLAADVLLEVCADGLDHVGHLGGDDFLLVLQSADAPERLQAAARSFARRVRSLYTPDEQAAGGLAGVDRWGMARFFPLLRLSIGAIAVSGPTWPSIDALAAQAARVKSRAKLDAAGLVIEPPATGPARKRPLSLPWIAIELRPRS